MLFQERTGGKRPLVEWNWKLGQSSGNELILQRCPWQQELRKGDAGVPSSVRLQHCKDLRRRISAARIKQDFLCNWFKKKIKNKKISVCALCFVSNQCSKSWVSPGSTAGRAALPGRHTDACKGAGGQCRQPPLPVGRAHITVQMQQREIIAK